MEAAGPWFPFGEDDRTLCRFTGPDYREVRPRERERERDGVMVGRFSKEEMELDQQITRKSFIFPTNTVC